MTINNSIIKTSKSVDDSITRQLTDSELAYLLCQYGSECKRQRSYLSAVVAYKRANNLLHNNADILCDLGASLWNYGDYELASYVLQKSINIKPTSITFANLGLVKMSIQDFESARTAFNKALELDPENVGALWDLALLQLLTGDWKEGLNNYECRMDHRGLSQYPKMPYPMWNGEDLNDKTIFIHGEQGMGDRILFSRYLYWLHEKYPKCKIKHITLPGAVNLMYEFKSFVDFIPEGVPYRSIKADYGLFMMSLAKFHGTTPDNIPPDPGLILSRVYPDKENVIGFMPGGAALPRRRSLKVGVRWTGNSKNDQNVDRSIPIEFLLELAENPDVTLYSLQVGDGDDDLRRLNAQELIVNIAPAISQRGYVGTASAMLHLDLVITPCTSIAHLAGALNIPTWLMLSADAYWCWLKEREDSPWYPSMKIFRQPVQGDWISVIEKIKPELANYAASLLSSLKE